MHSTEKNKEVSKQIFVMTHALAEFLANGKARLENEDLGRGTIDFKIADIYRAGSLLFLLSKEISLAHQSITTKSGKTISDPLEKLEYIVASIRADKESNSLSPHVVQALDDNDLVAAVLEQIIAKFPIEGLDIPRGDDVFPPKRKRIKSEILDRVEAKGGKDLLDHELALSEREKLLQRQKEVNETIGISAARIAAEDEYFSEMKKLIKNLRSRSGPDKIDQATFLKRKEALIARLPALKK